MSMSLKERAKIQAVPNGDRKEEIKMSVWSVIGILFVVAIHFVPAIWIGLDMLKK